MAVGLDSRNLARCTTRRPSRAALDARVLGSDMRATAKATLLGHALRIEHQIDPVEPEILDRMDGEGRILVLDLIKTFRDLDVDEPTVIVATRSLLRR